MSETFSGGDRIESQLVLLMRKTNDPEVLRTISDPKLVSVCADWVRSSLDVFDSVRRNGKSPGGIAMTLAVTNLVKNGANTHAYAQDEHSGKKTGSISSGQIATGVGFAAGQFGSSISLVKLANATSPAAAATTIGFTFADKMLQTTSLVADSDKARCYNALAKTAVNGGLMVFTSASGIGLVGFGIALAASAYEAGYYCGRYGAK